MTAKLLEKVWYRPSLIIFTNAEPTDGGTSGTYNIGTTAFTDYIILTDDNRSDMSISIERIESRKRMINGRMRSYHVADKKTFSVSWNDLPTNRSYLSETRSAVDGLAGAKKMLEWYEDHPASFWMMLVYDTPNPVRTGDSLQYRLEKYNVFFDNFDYAIVKRGSLFDHWNVSMSLVEV